MCIFASIPQQTSFVNIYFSVHIEQMYKLIVAKYSKIVYNNTKKGNGGYEQ